MIRVTDSVTKNPVFIAGKHIVAVFQILEGEHAGKTGMNMINGSIVCDEDILDIVSNIEAEND